MPHGKMQTIEDHKIFASRAIESEWHLLMLLCYLTHTHSFELKSVWKLLFAGFKQYISYLQTSNVLWSRNEQLTIWLAYTFFQWLSFSCNFVAYAIVGTAWQKFMTIGRLVWQFIAYFQYQKWRRLQTWIFQNGNIDHFIAYRILAGNYWLILAMMRQNLWKF